MSVYITDYITNPDIETEVLGNIISKSKETAEVILVWHQVINASYLSHFHNLKGIVRYGVGFDLVELSAVRDRGLIFCNTPDYGTDEVSDTVIGMLMAITRGIARYDYLCRNYSDNSWQENTLTGIRRTNQLMLGIIGAGRIGGSVLRKAKAIGFKASFYDPYKDRGYEKMLGVGRVDTLDELLTTSDIISINAPLTKETECLVDQEFIKKMKPGAALINTARGEIISDLDDFIDPLRSGKISGIALDVLPKEPPGNNRLIAAWKKREDWLEGKVIINPHTSFYSQESYEEMRRKASLNAKRIINGKKPYNIII
ncbi:lactate dehydrogenase [Nitrospinae bacterium]|nr:lactate dehydrogenase [Nitrospinota bacterium]